MHLRPALSRLRRHGRVCVGRETDGEAVPLNRPLYLKHTKRRSRQIRIKRVPRQTFGELSTWYYSARTRKTCDSHFFRPSFRFPKQSCSGCFVSPPSSLTELVQQLRLQPFQQQILTTVSTVLFLCTQTIRTTRIGAATEKESDRDGGRAGRYY